MFNTLSSKKKRSCIPNTNIAHTNRIPVTSLQPPTLKNPKLPLSPCPKYTLPRCPPTPNPVINRPRDGRFLVPDNLIKCEQVGPSTAARLVILAENFSEARSLRSFHFVPLISGVAERAPRTHSPTAPRKKAEHQLPRNSPLLPRILPSPPYRRLHA